MTSRNISTTGQYYLLTKSNFTPEEKQTLLEKINYDTFINLTPMVLFVTTMIVIGIPGNLLVFLVYLKRFKASAMRVFVMAMAVEDLVTNVFSLPTHIILMRFTYTTHGSYYCKVIGMFAVFPVLASYWILVCVAFDRRRRICQPFLRPLNARNATYLLILPFSLSAVLMIPFMPFYDEIPLNTGAPGLIGSTCGLPLSYSGVNVLKVFLVAVMISFVVGFSLLTFAYAHIVYKVCQQNKMHPMLVHRQSGAVSTGGLKLAKVQVGIRDTGESHENRAESTVEMVVTTADQSANLSSPDECPNVRTPSVTNINTADCIGNKCNDDAVRGGENNSNDSKGECQENVVSRSEVGHQVRPGGQRKRLLFSRTTLMMLVLTSVTLVCCVPEIALAMSEVEHAGVHLNAWSLNMRSFSGITPSVVSVINPFIYGFCNPNFRLQCRQFLIKTGRFISSQIGFSSVSTSF